jgi:excisionase family DNA binding protein
LTRREVRVSTPPIDPQLLTRCQAAQFLGISESKVTLLVRAGVLAKIKFGRSARYDKRDLLALVDKNRTGGRP